MNGTTNNIQIANFNLEDNHAGFRCATRNASGAFREFAFYGTGLADSRLERLQQYTSCLEALLMQKNHESSQMQLNMKSCLDQAEQKLAERERIMIHQAGHAAMGKMLGLVAHKWRQPLSVISLLVQNMKDAWEYGEFDEGLLNESNLNIMEQVNRLSRTIEDFRNYLNPPRCSEYFNPKQCVKDMVTLLSNCFSSFSDVKLVEQELPVDDLQVSGSHYAFQQVMHNLLTNANDAIQQRRQSEAGTGFSGLITVSFWHLEDTVVISVADNGIGVDESIQEQIFEPFFSLKEHDGGLGVGLCLSKIIIENSMGGSLLFENCDSGAMFNIHLPLVTAERRS